MMVKEKKSDVNILLVDDHQIIRDGIFSILEEEGYNATTASSGKEALKYMEKNEIDFLITDMSMKEMSGYELAIEAFKEFPEIKIIVLSMHEDIMLVEKLFNIGVHGYVLKDKGDEELIDAIESILHGKSYLSNAIKKLY